jgi:hypothetical protein
MTQGPVPLERKCKLMTSQKIAPIAFIWKKLLLLGIILPVLLLGFAGCSSNKPAEKASLQEEFTIVVGQSITVEGEDMVVTFDKVIGDSRCPKGVQCIWAGEVSIQVTIVYKGTAYPMALIQSGANEQATAAFQGYTLTFKVSPYPDSKAKVEFKDYELIMTVSE